VANDLLQTPSAADAIAQLWHTPALDLEHRQQLLARALAAGRPAGMKSWADSWTDDGEQDSGGSLLAPLTPAGVPPPHHRPNA
jgi:hypothetical protein